MKKKNLLLFTMEQRNQKNSILLDDVMCYRINGKYKRRRTVYTGPVCVFMCYLYSVEF